MWEEGRGKAASARYICRTCDSDTLACYSDTPACDSDTLTAARSQPNDDWRSLANGAKHREKHVGSSCGI